MKRSFAVILASVAALACACGQAATARPSSDTYRIVVAEGFGSGPQLAVRDWPSGKLERELPIGVAAPDWSRYYSVDYSSGKNALVAIDPRSGRQLGQVAIPVGYGLPDMNYPRLPGGLSPNGSWIALSTLQQNSFLVGATTFQAPFKAVSVHGSFLFDALSDDGRSLYLSEQLGDAGHYQIRLVDMTTGKLALQPVVDKREATEPMNGIRGDSVAAPNAGYVFTVYARDNGPFIHALPLGQPFAWCLDLPSGGSSNLEDQFHWSLATRSDGSSLYAVNGTTGMITQMVPDRLPNVGRSMKFDPSAAGTSSSAWAPVVDVDAKGAPVGGASLSPDGQTLYAVGETGVVAIDTSTLNVRRRYLAGTSLISIRSSPDGDWLFAASSGTDRIYRLNVRTGQEAHISGMPNPWAILWVEPI